MILGGGQRAATLHALNANDPLLLEGRKSAWLVESGSAAVFAVRLAEGRPQSHRRYLFSVGVGEVLLGAAPAGRALLAVPLESTTLQPLSSDEVALTDLGGWAQKLCKVLEPLAPPGPTAPVSRTHERGAVCVPPGPDTVWLRLTIGSLRLMGYEEGRIQRGVVFPFASGIWFITDSETEVEEATPEHRGIESLEWVLFRALDDLDRRQQQADRVQFDSRQQLNRLLGVEALRQLASAAGKSSEHPVAGALSPLLAAAQAVGRAQHLAVHAPIEDGRDALQAIAVASGFRTRRVLLEGCWWRQDSGPILAYRSGDKSPLALIPGPRSFLRGRFYELFDPAKGTRQKVTRGVAAALDPVAFTFYPPFGEKCGLWDLLAFGTQPYRRDLAIVAVCGAMTALLGMAAAPATALLVGQAIPDANLDMLLQVALAMGAALCGAMLFDLAQGISLLRVHGGIAIALQTAMWDRLLKLSPAFFRQFSTGELRTRVEGITRIQQQFMLELMRTIIVGLATAMNIGLMFYYSIPLGGIAAVSGLVVLVALLLHSRSLMRLETVHQDMYGGLSGLMVQLINGVGKLRVAGAEQRAFAQWARLYSKKQHVAFEIRRLRDRLHVINVSMPILAATFAFWFVAGRPGGAAAALPLGTFLAFNVALGTFMNGITRLSDAWSGLMSVPNLWKRTRTILDAHPEIESGKTHPGRLEGRVVFDHVSFRYRKDGASTLDDVTLRAEPGECIALVGPSGSGKSTILNLLLRFEVPLAGAIYFDGQELSSLDVAAVRRQLGVVSQDSKLMSQSIFENIVCGGLHTMAEAWEAARQAGLAEDIENMPMGMHTVISEGGSNVSGGQRQRIMIARALVRKPSILIFDEATSALDNRTQATVTDSLRRLRTTRIIVAHRLSTVRHADRIYVIEAGRVVQEGAFDELVVHPGLFAQLMRRQMA